MRFQRPLWSEKFQTAVLHREALMEPHLYNSRMSETENATGAASRGRKLQSARVGTLKSSIVQYWDK